MFKYFMWERHLMKPEGDPPAGGGGGGKPDAEKQYQEMKSMNEKLLARLDALEKKGAPAPEDDKSLADKAKLEQEEKDKKAKYEKSLEGAINFTSKSAEWYKNNASLLPETVKGVLDQAEKEKFNSLIEKDAEIKVGVITEFFGVQGNLDLLTASQKVALANFKGLTKDKKQDQTQHIYDSIFEPTFETLKKVKRAEQVAKGLAPTTQGEDAYKDKRLKLARKQFLGEKQ